MTREPEAEENRACSVSVYYFKEGFQLATCYELLLQTKYQCLRDDVVGDVVILNNCPSVVHKVSLTLFLCHWEELSKTCHNSSELTLNV